MAIDKAKFNSKNGGVITKHVAVYNGRKHNLSSTEWSRMIGCPISQVDRGLKKHYSMQAYLDECHADTQRRDAMWKRFIFSNTNLHGA